jgi:hypothetical protein
MVAGPPGLSVFDDEHAAIPNIRRLVSQRMARAYRV